MRRPEIRGLGILSAGLDGFRASGRQGFIALELEVGLEISEVLKSLKLCTLMFRMPL